MSNENSQMPGILNRLLLASLLLIACSCAGNGFKTLETIADARTHKANVIDLGEPGDSVGDILTFDQPLRDKQGQQIGNNSGICIRTRVAQHFQCQWTLTLDDGSIQVAGREMDKGKSDIAIIGGTGKYHGIRGQMESINNGDGTFTQILHYRLDSK